MWLSALLIFVIQSALAFLVSWVLELFHISHSGSVIPIVSGLVGAQIFAYYKEQKRPGALAEWGLAKLSAAVAAVNAIAVLLFGLGLFFYLWWQLRVPAPEIWADLQQELGIRIDFVLVLIVVGIGLLISFGVTWGGLRLGMRMERRRKS